MGTRLGLMAATTPDGRWKLGIGDPTVLGWATVVAYVLGVALCGAAGYAERRRPSRPLGMNRPAGPAFWWVLAIVLLALGINKQLDLQTALTDLGRALAKSQDWYQGRRAVQRAFIGAIALAGVVGLLGFVWYFRHAAARYRAAVAGLIFLVAFVTIRAASFHHVDAFLGRRVAGMKWNWLLELGGIALIAASAFAHLRSPGPPPPADPRAARGHRSYRIPDH